MIERWITNPLSLKRWKIFKSRKLGFFSFLFFLLFLFLSLTAEVLSNSKPLLLYYKSHLYTPIFKTYHPKIFKLEDQYIINYKQLKLGKKDWAIWPINIWDPYESNLQVEKFPSPPSRINWLGTDDRGRDVFSRILYGYRYSITFALFVWFFSYTLGSFFGAIMGYFGSWIDIIGQRLVEIIESLPILLILISLTTVIGRSFIFMIIFFSLIRWVGISLYMRAEFLRLRKSTFVEASQALGRSQFGVIFKHIFPNSLNPIITFSPFSLAGSISFLVILDYLGFGLVPPTPSWGELFAQSEKYITTAWWLALFPAIALFCTMLSLTFIGNAIRDAFDPKEI